MAVKLDAEKLAKKVTMTVEIKRAQRVRWRMKIAAALIKLAAMINPITVHIYGNDRESGLFYCPHCRRETFALYEIDERYQTINCRHCDYTFFIEVTDGEPKILERKDD